MLTESEACSRWCPFSHVSSIGVGNRALSGEPALGSFCLASKCAAWRWLPTYSKEGQLVTPFTRGFCGLAGEPNPAAVISMSAGAE